MLCDQCRFLLPQLIAEQLGDELQQQLEAHLHDCDHCLRYFAALSEQHANIANTDAAQLTARILLASGTNPCESSETLLCDFTDGVLDAEQVYFLERHLQECQPCQELQAGLQAVDTGLRLCKAPPVPTDLLADILRRTSAAESRKSTAGHRLLAFWQGLLQRPRFALEASFAVTVLWLSTFGTPSAVVGTAFAEQPALMERIPVEKVLQNTRIGLEKLVPNLDDELLLLQEQPNRLWQSGNEAVRNLGNNIGQEFDQLWKTLLAQPVNESNLN